MIGLLGLIYIGIWAGGLAKQRGKNKFTWTMIPIGIYFIIYTIAYIIMNLGFKATISSSEDRFPILLLVLMIKVAIVLPPLFITKLIMDRIFTRMNNSGKPRSELIDQLP